MQYLDQERQYTRYESSTSPAYMADFPSYLSRVFLFMSAGLLLTALVAVWVSYNPKMLAFAINMLGGGHFFISLLVYLGVVVAFNQMIIRANTPMALFLFGLYSVMTGFQFSLIGLAFSTQSIWTAFLAAAVLFATMAVYGMVTKRDLSKMGSILFCGLIAIIVMTIVNILFLHSAGVDMLLSIVGVVLFSGYTAYDIFRLRALYSQNIGEERLSAIAVYGAFMLYLDFINLFLYLLRLFGRSRD